MPSDALPTGLIFLLLQPIAPFIHELVPTPKRLVISVAMAAGILVFMLPLEALLRRGSLRQAALASALVSAATLAWPLGVLMPIRV